MEIVSELNSTCATHVPEHNSTWEVYVPEQNLAWMVDVPERTPFMICLLALLTAAMFIIKAMPGRDYRIPVSAIATLAALLVMICASGPLVSNGPPPWLLNPTGLIPSWDYFFIFLFTIVPGGEVLNAMLEMLEEHVLQLPHMTTVGAKGRLETFTPMDYAMVSCNTVSHFVIVSHLWAILLGPATEKRLESFTIVNGPLAFFASVLVNDLLYWCGHAWMHLRSIYPYAHKQHHRQCVPFRGYMDALNIHPFEEFLGAAILGTAFRIIAATMGMHAGTGWLTFTVWSVFNILNHFDYDSPLHVPVLFPSSPADHQMHHRVPNCNYSKLTMFWDRLFRTYLPYTEIGGKIAPTYEGPRFPSSKALPSPACVAPLMLALPLAALVVEAAYTLSMPSLTDFYSFVPSTLFISGVTVACAIHRRYHRLSKMD